MGRRKVDYASYSFLVSPLVNRSQPRRIASNALLPSLCLLADAMPWPRSSVPKFGNWDKNEDLSYSIVFDQVRAERESSLHSFNEDFETASSIRSLSPRSDGGVDNGTAPSFLPVKERGKREKFLPTFKANRRFVPPHRSASRSYDDGAEKGSFPSWQAAILRDHPNGGSQQYINHLQANPKNAPTYIPLPVSGVPSRQIHRKLGATIERQGPNQEHTKPTILRGPGRHMYQEDLANAKTSSRNERFNMQRKPIVPKFGDWRNGDGFTMMFNNVRKERSSKHKLLPTEGVTPLQTDEDLYKGSEGIKRGRGWLSFLCCSKPHL